MMRRDNKNVMNLQKSLQKKCVSDLSVPEADVHNLHHPQTGDEKSAHRQNVFFRCYSLLCMFSDQNAHYLSPIRQAYPGPSSFLVRFC